MDPTVLDQVHRFMESTGPSVLALAGIFFSIVFGVIFATVGGLIGGAVFKARRRLSHGVRPATAAASGAARSVAALARPNPGGARPAIVRRARAVSRNRARVAAAG